MTRVPYWTFTIRAWLANGGRTELVKRIDALMTGALLPRYTTQSYVRAPARSGDLLAIGITDTEILIRHVMHQLDDGTYKTRDTSDATFVYVGFDEIPTRYFEPAHGWRTTQ